MTSYEKLRHEGINLLFDAGYLGGYMEAMRHISGFLADKDKRAQIPLGYLRYLDALLDAWKVTHAAWLHDFADYACVWEQMHQGEK